MSRSKKFLLYLMIVFYFLAGVNHFYNPDFYMPIMPPYLPWHLFLIYFSGVMEILFALLLIPVRIRRVGAICIIILLILIFPANIQMTINNWHVSGLPFWISLIRLPIQIILIWWAALFARKNTTRTV